MTTKRKISAAVAAVAAAKPAKAVVKAANNIDATFGLLKTAGKKGIKIDLLAEKVGVTVKIMRRLIDSVRARGWYVTRVEACTFTLGVKKA